MSDLIIKVALDQSGIDAQLKTVLSKFKKAAKDIAAITLPAAAVAGIAKAVDALAAIGEEAIKSAGALQDQSRALGVTAEALQEFRLVASAAGVSSEQFDKALEILNRTIGNSALGKGTFEKDLANVGIQLRDHEGRVKSVSAIYAELSQKVSDGSLSQAQSISIAAAAFGRDGGKMVEVLRQTKEQQQAVIDTAREYGAILSNEVVAAADEYGDKLELIQKGTEALNTQSALILAPLAVKWAEIKNEIAGTVAELARAAGLIDDNATLQQRRLKKLEEQIKIARESHSMTAPGQSEADDPFLSQLLKQYSDLRREIFNTKKAAEEAKASIAPNADMGGGVAVQTAKQWNDAIDAMKIDIDDFGAHTIEVWQSLPEFQKSVNEALLDQEIEVGAQRIEVMRNLQQELLDGAIKHEGLLTQAVKDGAEQRMQWTRMESGARAKTIADDLVQITAGVAQHNKKMFELNKVAAIASAIMNTAQGVTRALAAYPPPFSFAMAAAQAAAGLAQVNAIKNTKFSGGGGGTTPSAAGAGATVNGNPVQDTPPAQRLVVEGISASSLFGGNAVRDLAQRLLQYQKDGGEVVLQ